MDPRNSSGMEGRYDGHSTAELLAGINTEVRGRRASQVREWAAIVAWADRNVIEGPEGAATLTERFLDTGVPIAGPGAPLVSEFGLMELIATLERSPEGGRSYVGKVIECAWRLPGIYTAVLQGRCTTYRAEQVADLTRQLSQEAATHVDQRLRGFVGSCTFAQVQRVLTEAIALYDPVLAEARRKDAADGRRFDIDLDQLNTVDANGLVHVDGLIDAADGADLDTAVGRRAVLLGKLGHDGSIDVRRAVAVGELARADLALDLEAVDEETGEVTVASPGRRAVLHVHLSDAALGGGAPVGRWEDQQVPVSTHQIKEWLQTPGTSVIVKPVIDLKDHVPVDSYEIPDRLKERVRLRDHHCRYPWCGRRAINCDTDHAQPHAHGLSLQPRPGLPQSPSCEDPQRVALRSGRPRHLPVDQSQRPKFPRRPPRHQSTRPTNQTRTTHHGRRTRLRDRLATRRDRPALPRRRPAGPVATTPHTPPLAGPAACGGTAISGPEGGSLRRPRARGWPNRPERPQVRWQC
jgi:hypothetical protein